MNINTTSKRARDILEVAEFLPDEMYHRTIIEAAAKLTRMGNGGMVYRTQWSSGTTLWGCDCGNCSLTVTADGVIR
jgi:hypothetical protein